MLTPKLRIQRSNIVPARIFNETKLVRQNNEKTIREIINIIGVRGHREPLCAIDQYPIRIDHLSIRTDTPKQNAKSLWDRIPSDRDYVRIQAESAYTTVTQQPTATRRPSGAKL
jgi:hypothetical protein